MSRSMWLIMLLAVAACLEEHPDWLGEAGATSSNSGSGPTSDGTFAPSDSNATTTEGASSGTSTSSDPTTGTSGVTSGGTDTGVGSTSSTGDTGTFTTSGSTMTTTGTNGAGRRIFATSTLRTGNLGGRAGADAFCQERADAAGLNGTWRALISTPAQSAAAALALTGPLENMVGETMAVDGADLWDGSLAAPVGYDEFAASAGGPAWTGTAADGSATVDMCEDWSTQVGGFKATLGTVTSIDAMWIENTTKGACSQSYRLYCVSD